MSKHAKAGRTTVVDVARVAGVSASTVSRHLRGVEVGEDRARRITQAVTRLQYQPDLTARALRGGRTRTIGVVIPQVNNSFYAQAVQYIEDLAREHGCAVILLSHQEALDQQAMQLATIRHYRADGVILAPVAGSTEEMIRNAIPGVPVVTLDRVIAPGIDSVVLRNRAMACLATKHLQGHGYRAIACVVSRLEISSFQERWEGYKDALAAAGIGAPLLIDAPDHDKLRAQLFSRLKGSNSPDALLCFSNRATKTVLQAFDELGLPRETRLPMLGFDDFDLAPVIDPPLTVVRQPTEAMIQHAVRILFARIATRDDVDGGASAAENIALDGDLIYRRSCGCA